MHSYIHTYYCTYIHTYIHTHIHTYINIHAYTYIHTYTHTHIHRNKHIYILHLHPCSRNIFASEHTFHALPRSRSFISFSASSRAGRKLWLNAISNSIDTLRAIPGPQTGETMPIHTYMHTYIHTFINVHTHSYCIQHNQHIVVFIHSFIFIHTYIHTYIHTNLTYTHTYIHIWKAQYTLYIHTYIYFHTIVYSHSFLPFRFISAQSRIRFLHLWMTAESTWGLPSEKEEEEEEETPAAIQTMKMREKEMIEEMEMKGLATPTIPRVWCAAAVAARATILSPPL
jgi:hypothetical protein